jgi:hypothetical protein
MSLSHFTAGWVNCGKQTLIERGAPMNHLGRSGLIGALKAASLMLAAQSEKLRHEGEGSLPAGGAADREFEQ